MLVTLDTKDVYQVLPATGKATTIVNRDTQNSIIIAPSQGDVILGSPSSDLIDPLGFIVVDGEAEVWGQCVSLDGDETAQISIQPGTTYWGASADAVAQALIAAGFATSIAAAIASSGISLVGAPQLLYNGQITSTTTTGGSWGSTIPAGAPQQYGLGQFDYAGARAIFDGPSCINVPSSAAKIFYTAGSFPTTPSGQMQAAITAGLKIYVCYDPGFNPTSATDRTNMLASLNAMKAACTAAANGSAIVGVILHNEPNSTATGKPTAAQYIASYNFYGGQIVSAGFTLGFCILVGGLDWTPWIQFSNGFTPTISFILVDMYASAYNNNKRIDNPDATNINTIAGAYTPKLGVGFGEIGRSASPTATPSDTIVGNFLTYLANFLTARTAAQLTNIATMWFDGPGTKNCIVPPPVNQNMGLVPLIRNFITAITSTPITGIGAGATAVMPPLVGTPTAAYAVANQLSYDITVNLTAGAASTSPFGTVQLDWFNLDQPTATAVKTVAWTMPAGTNGTVGTFTNGVGPMHGQFLKVSITNHDSVSMSVVIQLNGTGRPVARHNWQWDVASSVSVPTFALPTAATANNANVVGTLSAINVAASSTSNRLLGIFSGQVYVRFNPSVTTGKLTFTLTPEPTSTFGGTPLIIQTPTGEFETTIITPRCPLLMSIQNTDTVAHTADVILVSND